MKKLIVLSTMIILMASCNETKKTIETTAAVLTGNYSITSVNGNAITPAATLQFTNTDKAINGNAGCNDFSGNYSQDTMAINIGQLMATEAYCDEAIMKNERAIFKALRTTGTFTLIDDVLTLYSKTDRSPLLTASKEN